MAESTYESFGRSYDTPASQKSLTSNGDKSLKTKGVVQNGFLDGEVALHTEDVISYGRDLDPVYYHDFADVKARREAEITRARIEKREPNLENPPAAAGTPLRVPRSIQEELGIKFNNV